MKGSAQDGDGTIKWCPQCSGGKQHHELCAHDDAQLIKAPPQGTMIGGTYKFDSVIGVGGMGVVYKCHNWALRTVALKTLMARQYDAEELVRFQLEAKAAGKLTHSNLVSILDFGVTADGDPFMVMEYLEGKTLENLIGEDKLSLIEVVSIVQDCCDALAYAHRHGVTHRDLKPANIVLVSDLTGAEKIPKILDFGIAKVADAGRASLHLTQTGSIFGTPPYMSPEQCAGGEITDRSDVYSMGCVLYEALTGCKPFFGKTVLETYHLHQTAPLKPLSESRPNARFSKALEQLVLSMLSKQPQARPSIDSVRFDLAEVLKEELEREAESPELETPPKPNSSRALVIWGVAVLVGVSICAMYTIPAIDDVKHRNETSLGIISSNAGLDSPEQRVTQQLPPDTEALRGAALFATRKQLGKARMKFRELSFTEEQLDLLSKDRNCRSLSLFQYRGVTAQNFARLKNMNLTEVELTDTDADDAAVAEIARNYKSLTSIMIEDCPRVTDASVMQIARLPLKKFRATEIPITNRTVKAISGLRLHELDLRENRNINDQSISLIYHQPLILLSISNTSVTRDCLKYLCQMKQLQTLYLDKMPSLTDEDVRLLCRLPLLGCLSIKDCPGVTDRSIIYLEERIRKTEKGWYPFRRLWLDGTAVTAKSIPRLKSMKSLHMLGLDRLNGIDDLERNSIRTALPKTAIFPQESNRDVLGDALE
ncbi:MAG: protein kinase [Candidatus Obscuribacterales bacterium]|nr:protein kinase [Candidatus Obscuribacterales bacterium]